MKLLFAMMITIALGCESTHGLEEDSLGEFEADTSTIDTTSDVESFDTSTIEDVEEVESDDVDEEREVPEAATRWRCLCIPECGAESPILIGCDFLSTLEYYEVEGRLEGFCPPFYGCECECRECTSEIVPRDSCSGMML